MTDYETTPETEARAAQMDALVAEAEALVARMPEYDDGVQTPITAETKALVREAASIEKRINDLRRSAGDWREGNALVDRGRIAWTLKSRRLGLQTTPSPIADPFDLPARVVPATDADLVDGPTDVAAYQPGDLVAIYSRGAVREAVVVSTGKTKIEVIYTTATAVREAREHNRKPTTTRKSVATRDVFNHRPAPRATTPEEESNMAGKPDPKPTKKSASKRPTPSDDVSAVDAQITGSATSRSRKPSQAASKKETAPEKAPAPVVELPARDESPADLATSVVVWAGEATEAILDRVPSPSGAQERLRVHGTTVGYVTVGKRGATIEVKTDSGYKRFPVKSSDDVPTAGRALAETLTALAAAKAKATEEAAAK